MLTFVAVGKIEERYHSWVCGYLSSLKDNFLIESWSSHKHTTDKQETEKILRNARQADLARKFLDDSQDFAMSWDVGSEERTIVVPSSATILYVIEGRENSRDPLRSLTGLIGRCKTPKDWYLAHEFVNIGG